jgi:tetratricopeptide (TPR) repeat protein
VTGSISPGLSGPCPDPHSLFEFRPGPGADTGLWLERVRGHILEHLYSGRPADADSKRCMSLALYAWEAASGQENLAPEANLVMALALNGNERYEEAIPYFRVAIDGFEAVGQHETSTRACLGLAGSLQMVGACREALEVCRKADRGFVSTGDFHGRARALTNLGNIHHRLDEHEEALQCHRKAMETFEAHGDPKAMAMAALNVANGFAFLDRFPESDRMYRQSVELASLAGLEGLADQARYNHAYLAFLRGRYSDAIRSFNQLRDRFSASRSERHAALCDLDQSEIYLQLNLHREAADLASRAREAFRHLGLRYEEAKACAFLGVAEAQQRRYSEALGIFDVSEAMFAAESNGFWTAMVELYRAEVLLTLGRFWEARFLAGAAADRFDKLGMDAQRGMALIVLGRVTMALDGPSEARRLSTDLLALIGERDLPLLEFPAHMLAGRISEHEARTDEARAHYVAAAEAIEKHRSYLHHDELRVRFLDGKQSVYEALVGLELEAAAGEASRAFEWCERAKSRALADLLGQHLPAVRADADPSLLDRVHRLREELNSQYLRMQPDRGEFARPDAAEVRRTEVELERSLGRLADTDRKYGSLFGRIPGSLEDLQKALPADTTLVEYFVTRGEVMAFVIGPERLGTFRRLCPLDRVRKLRQGVEFQMERCGIYAASRPHLAEVGEGPIQAYLARLYDDLVRPWIPTIETSRLVIVPHGALHALPFHAFFDGETYLTDRVRITYAPSGEVFRHSVEGQAPATGEGFLVGVPDRMAPEIEREIHRIRAIAPGCSVLLGPEATQERFFAGARSAAFMHIATHSFFRKDNPMFSGFHLADGPVTALDLYSQAWSSELVSLGGCSSGVSDISGGDDLMGLVRGFLHAGARTLLMSLWNVNDRATAGLIETFYREWIDTGDKGASLQTSMRRVRQDYPHPFYWAGFVLIGAP